VFLHTKLLEAKQKDDVVTFEQLGVDRLYVDEAHYFKDLYCEGYFG
jgi:N12 class adenine-specific DNA methylase